LSTDMSCAIPRTAPQAAQWGDKEERPRTQSDATDQAPPAPGNGKRTDGRGTDTCNPSLQAPQATQGEDEVGGTQGKIWQGTNSDTHWTRTGAEIKNHLWGCECSALGGRVPNGCTNERQGHAWLSGSVGGVFPNEGTDEPTNGRPANTERMTAQTNGPDGARGTPWHDRRLH